MPADFADRTDFENADRGLIARLEPGAVQAADGRMVLDADAFTLFEVTAGIYQLRGIELSNMTLVEGATGVVVIDPAVSAEVAAAGLALYREHRGDRPVTAVIYTHSHVDHFGGVLGVVDADTTVPVVAPQGFLEHAVSGLIAPTLDITRTGQEETLDGVRIVFQITPGAEAPSEMNFYFPGRRALCLAENVTRNLHNLLTLGGAQVGDARAWSRSIAEAIELFGDDAQVAFASHHWPTWGTGNVLRLMTEQRDLYAYLHDQTVRLMNQGYVGSEIAEMIEMPPALAAVWPTHGDHGSVSHPVKAIYQRYLGWHDGDPAHLWQHPPEAAAARYVQVIGGVAATVAKAREFADVGDLRFAAELASHAVFADLHDEPARALLDDVLTRLGYGAECATWRDNDLTGAAELRADPFATVVSSAGMAPALTITELFDSLAIRIDGKRAWDVTTSIRWHFTDSGETYRMELSNGALIHYPTRREDPVDVIISLTRPQLLAMLAGAGTDGVQFVGHARVFDIIAGFADQPDPALATVTP